MQEEKSIIEKIADGVTEIIEGKDINDFKDILIKDNVRLYFANIRMFNLYLRNEEKELKDLETYDISGYVLEFIDDYIVEDIIICLLVEFELQRRNGFITDEQCLSFIDATTYASAGIFTYKNFIGDMKN